MIPGGNEQRPEPATITIQGYVIDDMILKDFDARMVARPAVVDVTKDLCARISQRWPNYNFKPLVEVFPSSEVT